MTSQVCVDAGVLLKLVVDEADSHLAERLWQRFAKSDLRPIAPPLLPFEITAVLRKNVYRGLLSPDLGYRALEKAFAFGVEIVSFDGLHRRAWELAQRFDQPSAYDSHYLALAEERGCTFWTADGRLHRAVSEALPWVRHLSELEAEPG